MDKPKVFVPNRIPDNVLRYLDTHCDFDYNNNEEQMAREEFLKRLSVTEGLVASPRYAITTGALNRAPRLRVVSNIGVGYDNLDLAAMRSRNIAATNTPDVLTGAVADLTFGMLLSAARRISEADRYVKEGRWIGWQSSLMLGRDVHGARLGIVGMGRIGEALVHRAKGFNMEVLYHNRNRRSEEEDLRLDIRYVEWAELFRMADFLVVLVPLTPATVDLVGEREFRLMKPDAFYINVSRGAVTNETALVYALQHKWIAGAALDVYEREPVAQDHPLLAMPNVVTLPHIGSASVETRARMAMTAAVNAVAALKGEIPPNLILNVQER